MITYLNTVIADILELRMTQVNGVPLTGRIGYVYPDDPEWDAFYIHSNLRDCLHVVTSDGSLYAEISVS